jgi:uncharacterized protein YkwD
VLVRALAALTVLLVPTLVSIAPTSATAAASASIAVYESQAVKTTNRHRVRRDMRALRTNRCLSRFADRQASRMADRGRIYHQDLGPVLRRCDLRRVGENVAVGYPTGESVVTDGWMRSSGHRRNILTRKFGIVAVGAARDGAGRWYTAQVLGHR